MNTDTRPPNGGWAPGKYMKFCATCGICFAGDKRATTCAECAYRDSDTANAVINQWSSDVDRLMRELQKANDRIAELERELSAYKEGLRVTQEMLSRVCR